MTVLPPAPTHPPFGQLADVLPVAIYTCDVDGVITYCNEKAVELWGRRPALGRDSDERFCGSLRLYRPDGTPLPHDQTPMAMALRDGTPSRGNEVAIERPDGTRITVSVNIDPIVDESGTLVGAVNAFQDITAQRLEDVRRRFLTDARASLTETLDEQELARKLVGIAVPAIADWASLHTIDDDGSVRRIAAAYGPEHLRPIYEHVLAMRPDAESGPPAVIRRSAPELYTDLSADTLVELFAEDARERARGTLLRSAICVPLRSRSGTIAALSLGSTTPGRYTEGDLRLAADLAEHAAIAMENARLYAEARRTAERLRAANSAKDEFLGLVSHELKTPITVILGNARLLTRAGDELEPVDRRSALEDVARESDRLHGIIDNLLVLARLEQGQHPEAEPVDLGRTIERAVDDARRAFPARTFEVRADASRSFVLGEPVFLRQVLWNLLTNAVKYGSDHAIEVEVSRVGSEARTRVLDRGRGIDPAEAERLFEPFYRSRAAGEDVSGVGIGLTVCRRLIEAQGGRVWARPRDGGGADIGFALPLLDE
jgi:signal transduction histidine kinase